VTVSQTASTDLRNHFRKQHGETLGDLLYDAEARKADEWNAHVATLAAERQAKQDQLDARAAYYEETVVAPLRRAAADALAAHIATSTDLENARIRCESEDAVLQNQIVELTKQMATPQFPTPTAWKRIDVALTDARETLLAAQSPMQIAGGWIDGSQIKPEMPTNFGPRNAKAS
jgi:hypothetical protein